MDNTSDEHRWTLYEFLNARGEGVTEVWVRDQQLQKKAIAQLNLKLDLLERNGADLSPKLLSGTGERHISKLHVKVPKMQLRPLLCRGPLSFDSEFTLLLGAIERNNKLRPDDALRQAAQNRQTIVEDPKRRRLHEHPF